MVEPQRSDLELFARNRLKHKNLRGWRSSTKGKAGPSERFENSSLL
jgi:hypothetical protein